MGVGTSPCRCHGATTEGLWLATTAACLPRTLKAALEACRYVRVSWNLNRSQELIPVGSNNTFTVIVIMWYYDYNAEPIF